MDGYTNQHIPFSSFDSTALIADSSVVYFEHRATSADQIFSSLSVTPTRHNTLIEPSAASAISWSTAVGIIVLLSLYCWFVARFHKYISTCFKASASLRDIAIFLDSQNSNLKPFLRIGRLIFFVSCALQLSVVVTADSPSRWNETLIVSITIYLYFALLIKGTFSRIANFFDQKSGRMHALSRLCSFNITFSSIIIAPCIIICSASNSLTTIGLSIIALAILIHWCRILVFFKLFRFSILQWILYLCALEVVPFTLIIGVLAHLNV